MPYGISDFQSGVQGAAWAILVARNGRLLRLTTNGRTLVEELQEDLQARMQARGQRINELRTDGAIGPITLTALIAELQRLGVEPDLIAPVRDDIARRRVSAGTIRAAIWLVHGTKEDVASPLFVRLPAVFTTLRYGSVLPRPAELLSMITPADPAQVAESNVRLPEVQRREVYLMPEDRFGGEQGLATTGQPDAQGDRSSSAPRSSSTTVVLVAALALAIGVGGWYLVSESKQPSPRPQRRKAMARKAGR